MKHHKHPQSLRKMASAAFAAMTGVTLFLITGCAAAPPDHFYSLSNGISVLAAKLAAPDYFIELAAVTVPQQIARYQMVVSTQTGQIDLLEHERWSATPATEIAQALSLAITGELGTLDVLHTATPEGATVYRISTHVQRFESVPGKYALIDAVWSVRLAGSNQVRTCRSIANEAVSPGYDALVAGHRRAVLRIASDMTKIIRAMAANTGTGC